ncbi:hypothetical protein B0H17DRAFT_1146886 [Mycena rosella]|uniref:Uncharacterized protein n=1 Tax=Mycena rosella TaxID=1033263 RepID=A0AAD7G3Z5_MYCRO|nr:hypothetical protein B0H17DRAFT_1146886 [Mycena rosella]
MVASDATIYNGVKPGTVTAIKADMPGHLIASVFLGGKTLNECIIDLPKQLQEILDLEGPEGWCKVRDPPTCTKVPARELYIKSDVAAFSIITLETTQNSWVAGFLECSDDGNSPIAAEQLCLQAIIYMLTDATRPSSHSPAGPIWNAQMGAFILYVKLSTTNTVHWQGIVDLVGGRTFQSAYYEYKPHSRKRLLNENQCILCKHTHFMIACPCSHTLLYWGPKHQVKDTTDDLLAGGRSGGQGGRGAPGGHSSHRMQGTRSWLVNAMRR